MHAPLLLIDFARWYYTAAFRDTLRVWLNYVWFITHYFSMVLLLRTLFAPWKRMQDPYRRNGLEELLSVLIVNTLSRIVGATIRLTLIVTGLVSLLVAVVLLFLWLALWVSLPVMVVVLFTKGLTLLFI